MFESILTLAIVVIAGLMAGIAIKSLYLEEENDGQK
jgi:hypothetical protein